MRLVLAVGAALFVFAMLTWTQHSFYQLGFRNGTQEAYSHIDDTQSRCK
jgi:hypothetical protein